MTASATEDDVPTASDRELLDMLHAIHEEIVNRLNDCEWKGGGHKRDEGERDPRVDASQEEAQVAAGLHLCAGVDQLLNDFRNGDRGLKSREGDEWLVGFTYYRDQLKNLAAYPIPEPS